MQRQKFLLTFCLFLTLLLLLPAISLAHPPSRINAVFNPETKVLELSILHQVGDPQGDHYINSLTISLNGKVVIEQVFLSQFTQAEQKALYLLNDAQEGDVIEIKAVCSKFGEQTLTYQVE